MGGPGDDKEFASFYMQNLRSKNEERGRLRYIAGALFVLAFAVILWYAYPRGEERYADMQVPIVRADTDQYKFKPEEPGGMDVPHRDSTVFEPLENTEETEKVERLLPAPEQPVERPKPSPDTQTADTDTDTDTDTGPTAGVEPVETVESVEDMPEPPEVDAEVVETMESLPKPDEQAETAKTEPAPKTAATTASSGGTGPARLVQLGSFRSEDAAQTAWKRVTKEFGDLLSGYTPQVNRADLGAKGVYYRLQIGPFPKSKAADICEDIKRKKPQGCILARP